MEVRAAVKMADFSALLPTSSFLSTAKAIAPRNLALLQARALCLCRGANIPGCQLRLCCFMLQRKRHGKRDAFHSGGFHGTAVWCHAPRVLEQQSAPRLGHTHSVYRFRPTPLLQASTDPDDPLAAKLAAKLAGTRCRLHRPAGRALLPLPATAVYEATLAPPLAAALDAQAKAERRPYHLGWLDAVVAGAVLDFVCAWLMRCPASCDCTSSAGVTWLGPVRLWAWSMWLHIAALLKPSLLNYTLNSDL